MDMLIELATNGLLALCVLCLWGLWQVTKE